MPDSIGSRIKLALNARDMNQAELSKLTGIPKSSLSQYISGKFSPKRSVIAVLALSLNVDEAWLLGYGEAEDIKENQHIAEEFNSNKAIANPIGERLKYLRNLKDITLSKACELYNEQNDEITITRSALYSYERGEKVPSPEVLLALCQFYSANIQWLISGEVPQVQRYMDCRKNIKVLLKINLISLRTLCKNANIPYDLMDSFMKGEIVTLGMQKIDAIANALNVTIDDLFTDFTDSYDAFEVAHRYSRLSIDQKNGLRRFLYLPELNTSEHDQDQVTEKRA